MIGVDTILLVVIILVALVAFTMFVNDYLYNNSANDFKKLIIDLPQIDGKVKAVYDYLMPITIVFFTITAILSALVMMGEFLNLFPKETAFSMFIWSVVGVVLTVVFPDVWNGIALMMQSLAYSIIDNAPKDQPSDPDAIAKLFIILGGFGNINTNLTDMLWGILSQDVQNTIKQQLLNVITSIIRAFITAMVIFLMYVVGTIRFILTAMMAVAFPLVFALHQIPLLKRVTGKLIDTLIGLTIAPLLSALIIVIGASVIDVYFPPTQGLDAPEHFKRFIGTFSIVLLAVLIPTLTAPLLGTIVTQATMIGQSALLAGLYAGVKGAEGFARGAIGVYRGLVSSGMIQPGLGGLKTFLLSKHAIDAAKSGLKGGIAGVSEGMLKGIADMGPKLGFGDVTRPLARIADVMHDIPVKVADRTVRSIVTNHRGSLIEGATLLYAKSAMDDLSTVNLAETQSFLSNIRSLTEKGNYVGVADEFNKMLKIPNYDKLDKAKLGRSLAEYASAFSSNTTASRAFYAGLKQLSNEGGIEGLMKNRADAIDDITFSGHEYIKPALERELEIQIPDSIHGMDVKPSDGQLKVMYEVKYTIGSLLKNVDDNLRAGLTFSGVELQGTIRESLTSLIQNKYPNLSDWQVSSIVNNVVEEAQSLALTYTEGKDDTIGTKALHVSLYNLQTGNIEPTVDTQTIDLSDLTTENGKLLKPEQPRQPADWFNHTK
jgi:hypothetical protein